MRIGCSIITFGNRPVEESLRRIAELGFDVVDVAAVPSYPEQGELVAPAARHIDRLAGLVQRHGFDVAGLQSAPWVPDFPDDPDEFRRRYTMAADVAATVGARVWIVDANVGIGAGPDRAAGLDRFKRATAVAAELADSRGLQLAVEVPHGGSLGESLPEIVELFDASELPQLGIDLDTSHVLNCGASTREVLAALGDRVVHVALRDGRRGGGPFLTPGDGDFDFAEFFPLLSDAGYTGDVMLELEPPDEDASADARATEAIRARNHLTPLLTG